MTKRRVGKRRGGYFRNLSASLPDTIYQFLCNTINNNKKKKLIAHRLIPKQTLVDKTVRKIIIKEEI